MYKRSRLVIVLVALATASTFADESKLRDDDDLAELISRLGDDSEQVRSETRSLLLAFGESVLPQLHKAARESRDFQVRKHAELIARQIMFAAWRRKAEETSLVLVKPGEFLMGSSEKEKERRKDELQHIVRITRPYLIAKHEVRQDEYHAVMNARPSWFSLDGEGRHKLIRVKSTGNFPVDSVTWFDAIEFCNRLSQLRGLAPYYSLSNIERKDQSIVAARVGVLGGDGYRLPTEAEWEYACRAGTTTSHHFGTLPKNSPLSKRGNFQYHVMTRNYGLGFHTRGRPTEVGEYRPNPWGICDMHGSVAEWCWDWYDEDYYSKSPPKDPTGPASGLHRVLRGGSFLATQPNCRSATRFWSLPGETKYYIGFRVARNAPDSANPERAGQSED